MVQVREATESFLDDHPDAEDGLYAIIEHDRDGPWTFEEIPFDSGLFGEFVSQDLVEEAGDAYRLRDREAVVAALRDEPQTQPTASGDGDRVSQLGVTLPETNPRILGAVLCSLLIVAVFRVLAYPQVFRNGDIVLLANDPYYYRYWVETLLVQASGQSTIQVLSTLPGAVAKGEPLMVATLWLLARLVGGDASAAGTVLAWYPVVSAVIVGAVVYLLGTRLFSDRRVGLAAVVMLALIPAHAFRSSLGFADHHAFDYLWLALTLLSLVLLAQWRDPRDWRAWAVAVGLGLAVAGQTLAWEAGPLLLLPIGVYAFVRSLADVRASRSPLRANLTLLTGLGLGALLTGLSHQILTWHTPVVAFAPALLFAGCLGIVGVGALATRVELSATYLALVELVALAVGLIALPRLLPAFAVGLDRGVTFLLETQGIAETQSIVSGQLGSIFAPALLFGFILFLALPYLGWLSFRAYRDREFDPALLVPIVYSWFFLSLATIQARFAGELSLPIAVIAGLSFVQLLSWLDLARPTPYFDTDRSATRPGRSTADLVTPTIPDRRAVVSIAIVMLLVGSMSVMMVPVKTSQLTIPNEQYQAATWMDEHAANQEWEAPENYVFSQWGRNRMYNYFVNGNARSYAYAQSNYDSFATASDGESWYMRLRDRAGFIVTEDLLEASEPLPAQSLHTRLHNQYGSASGATPGLAHYRAVYVSEDESLKVFTLVPGARLVGTAAPNTTVTVRTTQSVTGTEFTYSRTVDTNAAGEYAVTVPYAGQYEINGVRVQVSMTAVRGNQTVSVSNSS